MLGVFEDLGCFEVDILILVLIIDFLLLFPLKLFACDFGFVDY